MAPGAQHAGFRLRLIDSREIAPVTRHFVFEVPDRTAFGFVPGQFVSLTAEINGKSITRAYSMASPPEGNRVELCLNLVTEGLMSPYLFALQPGDEIDAKGPYGGFVFRRSGPALCIATGTGIAPFRSMLRERLAQDATHEHILIFGARHEHGLLYLREWQELQEEHKTFRFIPTLTRPLGTWTGNTGRVQAHVLEVIGGRTDFVAHICGLKEMVEETRKLLMERGFDRKAVIFEKYD